VAHTPEIAGQFQRICTTIARWGKQQLFTHWRDFGRNLLDFLDIPAYAELISDLMCECNDAFCPPGASRSRYLCDLADRARFRGDADLQRSYNVFWAIQLIRENEAREALQAFRDPDVFERLVSVAIGIAKWAGAQPSDKVRSLVGFVFRVLGLVMEGFPGEDSGTSQAKLEDIIRKTVALEWGELFKEGRAGAALEIVIAVFPVL
jgi:hypothetical protein